MGIRAKHGPGANYVNGSLLSAPHPSPDATAWRQCSGPAWHRMRGKLTRRRAWLYAMAGTSCKPEGVTALPDYQKPLG